MNLTTKNRTAMYDRIRQHGENLLAIFPRAKVRDPVTLCKRLRRLEAQAAAVALRMCNGPEFPEPDEPDKLLDVVLAKVNELLGNGGSIPVTVNRDPRGYALKIESEWLHNRRNYGGFPAGFHRDMGGYGIIAPDLTEAA